MTKLRTSNGKIESNIMTLYKAYKSASGGWRCWDSQLRFSTLCPLIQGLGFFYLFLIFTNSRCLPAPAETWPRLPASCLDFYKEDPGCWLCPASTCALVPTPSRSLPAPADTWPQLPASCLDLYKDYLNCEWHDRCLDYLEVERQCHDE